MAKRSDEELLAAFDGPDADGLREGEYNRYSRLRDKELGRLAHLQCYTKDSARAKEPMTRIRLDYLYVPETRRKPNADRVLELVESIRRVGLLNPPIITYRDGLIIDGEEVDGVPVLIAGRHRIEAMKLLGFRDIDVIVVEADDVEAELIEIAENLHRAELTALERDVQIARWIELTGARREAEEVSAQGEAKPQGGRPEGGVRAAARELGIEKEDARRAVKVASLSPEAKQVAVEAGLDNNRTALLAAAKEPTPERQVAKVKEWDTKREGELAKRAVAKKQIAEAVSVEAPAEVDGAADDLALFLVEYLPANAHREAVQRLRAVSIETARAFADLALPDVPLGLTLAGSLARRAA